MPFHDSGVRRRRPLTQDEINTTARRIENIVGDPARSEFSDPEFNAWSERQVDRTTDINGNIVSTKIEPFKPKVTRQDLNLDGSVGDNANNARREVFAVKKVLSKAGAFTFDAGNEPTTVANDRFKTAIRTFQAGNGLAADGLIRSGGPTIHALGFKTMGQENGRPSGFDAADFKAATGRDPNRLLSGKPIFAEAGSLDTNTTLPAGGEGSASFGGPLELGGTKSESGVGGEIARGAQAQPTKPPVTHRQAERESFAKLTQNEEASAGGDPGRNKILERAGFKFARSPLGGGRWLDIDGNKADPNELRLIITNTIRHRAIRENWSAGRILQELHKARSGLPFDDRKNVQTAFFFLLPFFGAAIGGGAVGGAAVAGGAAAGATAVSLTGILTAIGLGAVAIGLSGDTPREKADAKAAATPKAKAKEKDDDKETITVYRVEDENFVRIFVRPNGDVIIKGRDNRMLFLNFGDKKHAEEWLRGKLFGKKPGERWKMKSFRVPRSFAERVRAAAIREFGSKSHPEHGKAPIRVDTDFVDQFGLPRRWIRLLREEIVKQSGKVHPSPPPNSVK